LLVPVVGVLLISKMLLALFQQQHLLTMADQAMKVLLAQKWSDSKDPTGWWMSEKLDGVR
jgi:hypothetical protein